MEIRASTRGRIVIPSAVRRKLGIQEGTRIKIEADEKRQRIILKPITRRQIEALYGKCAAKGILRDLEEERARERDR